MQKTDFFTHINTELAQIKSDGLYKTERIISGPQSANISVDLAGGEEQVLNFCANDFSAFERIKKAVKLTRFGGDCYLYSLIAAGQLDLVVETALEAYDIAALVPIVENAGGVITTWEGEPASNGGRIIAAGCRELHEAAMELLHTN